MNTKTEKPKFFLTQKPIQTIAKTAKPNIPMSPSSIGLNTVLSFQEALFNGTAFAFCQYCWLHTAGYTLQINSFELGDSTHKLFDGNYFLLSRRSRVENMKSEKCKSCFSRQKFTLWFTSLQVKQVDFSRLTSQAHALVPSLLKDYPHALPEIDK